MLRAGRVIFNPAKVIKVVNDGKAKTTTVYLENGMKASFKKHSDAVWSHYKRAASTVAAPSASSSRRGW